MILPAATDSAPSKPTYDDVPRGNTQKNVHRQVLRYLLERSGLSPGSTVLDTSCGDGEFLTSLRRFWPAAVLTGCDIKPRPAALAGMRYEQVDLSRPFDLVGSGQPFDLITSISGVMMFGNTQTFIESCARQLRVGGVLVVTNDNVLTVRDRLSYFFFGRVRRFKLLFSSDEAISQYVQQQELKRLLETHGIQLEKVEYTAFYAEDLLFVPLALLVFPVQWLHLRCLRNHTPPALRQQLFGFRSLLGRHYIFIGRKQGAVLAQ